MKAASTIVEFSAEFLLEPRSAEFSRFGMENLGWKLDFRTIFECKISIS